MASIEYELRDSNSNRDWNDRRVSAFSLLLDQEFEIRLEKKYH